jgi:hypothetical protein
MKMKWPRLTSCTDEEQNEFEEKAQGLLEEIGLLFAFLLHKTPEAKNFLKLGYGNPKEKGSFDLILRKLDSDPDVICGFCGKIKTEGKAL